jgi:hypothetical protein
MLGRARFDPSGCFNVFERTEFLNWHSNPPIQTDPEAAGHRFGPSSAPLPFSCDTASRRSNAQGSVEELFLELYFLAQMLPEPCRMSIQMIHQGVVTIRDTAA